MLANRNSLTDRVAAVLIDRIARGVYPVGSKLPAGRLLAQEFDVSAAVIREATERLRTKGLVRSRQGAGCVVLASSADGGFQLERADKPDPAALLHIYELRVGVEGAAAALAAQRATEEDFARMAHILSRLRASLDAPDEALEWDLAFHRSLAEATHNPHYPELMVYLSRQWRESVAAARRHTLQAEAGELQTRRVHDEHEAILTALRTRDPQAAAACAQEHLYRACERLGLNPAPQTNSIHSTGHRT